jgi:hypothetical protein
MFNVFLMLVEALNNRGDNLPLIQEATEREPRGSRIKNFKHIIN